MSQTSEDRSAYGTALSRLTRRAITSPSIKALVGTGLGSLPGFALPFIVVWHFKIGRITDTYFFALAVATFTGGLLSVVLEANVIPAARHEFRRSRVALNAFIKRGTLKAATTACAAHIGVSVIALLLLRYQSHWTAEQIKSSAALLAVLGPYVSAIAVSSIFAAALYVTNDFLTPTITQAMRALVPLAVLAFVGHQYEAAVLIAAAMAAGEAGRSVVLAARLRARTFAEAGPEPSQHRPRLLRTMFPHALSMLVVSANPVVDRTVASSLRAGSVTILDLGEKILYAPLLAITSSIVLVAGTRWAAIGLEDRTALAADYRRSLRVASIVSVAAAAVIAVGVVVATRLSGATFAGADASQLRTVVVLFVAGLPGAVMINMGSRFLSSVAYTKVLPLFGLCAFVTNLVGDLVGAALFQVAGIALASTLVRYVNAGLYVVVCLRLVTGVR